MLPRRRSVHTDGGGLLSARCQALVFRERGVGRKADILRYLRALTSLAGPSGAPNPLDKETQGPRTGPPSCYSSPP